MSHGFQSRGHETFDVSCVQDDAGLQRSWRQARAANAACRDFTVNSLMCTLYGEHKDDVCILLCKKSCSARCVSVYQ